MLPVFRSTFSAISFCVLLIVLPGLPVVTNWAGHPPREQAYAGMSTAVGPVGMHVREIFNDSPDTDVLFLGSSLVRSGVDVPMIESAMSAHLGRPAHIEMLALNWQGLDLQYFLLRDYLSSHHVKLIVWNLPVPGSRSIEPHVEAFRWVRFGEYSDALSGLSLPYRLALYGDMVLGAPREMLSHFRPNLLSKNELDFQVRSERMGYYGRSFVPDVVGSAATPTLGESYEDPRYHFVYAVGKPLDPYEDHFAGKIVDLARQKRTKIALLHIPIDSEQGLTYMPERCSWTDELHTAAPMIGSTSAVLFRDVNKERFYNFYRDQHFNLNGSVLFTQSIIPAILKAYDTRGTYE
ncbi:MAG: hypothetical protein WAK26_05960 [Terracidiphilus sp.]